MSRQDVPLTGGSAAAAEASAPPEALAIVDDALPQLTPIEVRPEVVHIIMRLPYVTYIGRLSGKTHGAVAVIDFAPRGTSVDTTSLETWVDSLRDKKFFAEDLAVHVAREVAETVNVPVDVKVEQHEFNKVVLTTVGHAQPVGGQAQQAAEPNG
jgi:NADPH-dependent 7-cyano-7-deazaguanine reductase QueF